MVSHVKLRCRIVYVKMPFLTKLVIDANSKLEQNVNIIPLSSITDNHISLTCLCTHWSLLPVKDLIEVYGPHITVDQVEKAARCIKCGAKGVIRTQIIYVGNSEIAMSSAYTPWKNEDE